MKRLDHKQGVLHGPPMYVFPFRQSCTEIPLPVCAWRYFCKSCTHIVPATVEIMHQNASACVCMEILLQVINSDSPCIVFKSCIEMLLPVFEKYRSLVALTQSLANVAAHCAETSRFCVIELAGYVENLKGKQGHETSLLKLPGLVPSVAGWLFIVMMYLLLAVGAFCLPTTQALGLFLRSLTAFDVAL
eukprot:scaffold9671_cov18-Tisochrysis_lutea.AAC.1